MVPLRKGIVPWPDVITCLNALRFDGWVSIHAEYKSMTPAEVIEQTKDDLAYLLPLLAAGLADEKSQKTD